MDNIEILNTANFWVRAASRIGFVVLLVAFYKLYTLIASPLAKIRYKSFIRLLGVSILISFALLTADYLTDYPVITLISMMFNGATTFGSALYILKQAKRLESHVGSEEYEVVKRAMDALMLRMKYR